MTALQIKNRLIRSIKSVENPKVLEDLYKLLNVEIENIDKLSVQEKFEFYKKQWKENTKYSSTIREMGADKNFKEIVSLGFSVLPYIFKELETKTDRRRWINALHKITGADPVKPGHTGNLEAIAQDWLDWGKLSKYI